jgi:CO/xanthine dehydrogenase Mo-binding subunit
VVQALGWALLEDCKWRDGAMENAQLTNYIIPTAGDVPPIRVDFLEAPYAHGAGGAKGIGELPFDGVAPAVANAIAEAVGVDLDFIPITPERLLERIVDSAPAGGST